MINIQPIEKLDQRNDGSLDVHSIFYTIQGEGIFAGRPAVFVRLAGCNLQCPGCDTDYTSQRTLMHPMEIGGRIIGCHTAHNPHPAQLPIVVITGGEPFRQNITPLCTDLIRLDYTVQIETNGTLPPSPDFGTLYSSDECWTTEPGIFRAAMRGKGPFIVVSPKNDKVQRHIEELAVAYKYVVDCESGTELDGLPKRALDNECAKRLARPPQNFCGTVYLQPRDQQDDRKNAANLELAKAMCMKHGYTLQLQIHKLIGMD
jgi:7-carboxy-7-deazaguanine synthase